MTDHPAFNDDLLRRVFAATPAGLVVLDTNLEMIGVTDAYLQQTATSRDDIIGHYAFETFPDNPEDDAPTSMNAMLTSYKRVLEVARSDSMALQRYDIPRRDDPNGEFDTKYWAVVNSPIFGDDGSVVGIIHRADDVTDVVQDAGDDPAQSSDVSFLQNAAMMQRSTEVQETNRRLRLADSAKNEFLSRMSHELRTPLNAVVGFAQLMLRADLPPEEQDSTNHILKAGRHLLSLINDVLDLSGIESGQVRLSLEAVDLRAVAIEVTDLLSVTAAARDIALVTADIPAVIVQADRQRLKQVLLNLVSNAIKYNRRAGRVSLIVRQGSARVAIGVQDDGPGILPEHQARLFTPFDRLGAEQSEVEGTGLGLALSRTLVEAMGGSIRLESTVGQGSTFWLELDRAEEESFVAADRPAPSDTPDYESTSGTLLYVEDNLANAKLMERIIAPFASLRLVTALQGSMAVELAETQQPGLILLDLNLPDIAGEVVLARLKAEPSTRHIPVVIVSADANPRQAERLRDLGAHAYVTKPFDLDELIDLIRSHFAETTSCDGVGGAR
jgi:signal transduction histidine kinase/CheY-like chemotaxis protein